MAPHVDTADGADEETGDGDVTSDVAPDTVSGPDASVEACACPDGFVCDDSGACVEHVCGDGPLGPGKTCDPPESCPTSCDDAQACTADALVGSAADCTAACEHPPVISLRLGRWLLPRRLRPGDGRRLLGRMW